MSKSFVLIIIEVYYYILLGRIILTWFSPGLNGSNSILSGIYRALWIVTEPLLAPLRKIIPPLRLGQGYLDLSPILIFVLLFILRGFLISL